MYINIGLLAEKLSIHNPEFYVYSDDITVKNVKLLGGDVLSFDPDILYIGYASALPKNMSTVHKGNFLCIADKGIPQKYKKSSHLNLIIVGKETDLISIFNTIQDILTNQRELEHCSAKLLNSLINGNGIQQIVDTAFELIGNPIVVLNTGYEVLAYTKDVDIDDPVWNHTVTTGKSPDNFVRSIKTERIIEKVYKSKSAVIVHDPSYKHTDIMGKVEIDGRIVAHVGIGQYLAPFKENDVELATLLCSVLSAEMQKSRLFRSTKRIMYEHFITDLLDGKTMKTEIMDERIMNIELKLKKHLYIMTINIEDYEIQNTTIGYTRDQLESLIRGSKSVVYNDHIVLVINTDNVSPLHNVDLQGLTSYLRNNKMYGGLSRGFSDISLIRKYYRQSLRSIKLGILMDKQKFLFNFDDYAPYHLMDLRSKEENIKDFCHPGLIELMDYDQQNDTFFTQSLSVYIENARNIVESARILHIHRNTMTYRVEKIQKIMNVDLRDKNTLFHIHLSLKILEFTGELTLE